MVSGHCSFLFLRGVMYAELFRTSGERRNPGPRLDLRRLVGRSENTSSLTFSQSIVLASPIKRAPAGKEQVIDSDEPVVESEETGVADAVGDVGYEELDIPEIDCPEFFEPEAAKVDDNTGMDEIGSECSLEGVAVVKGDSVER
jgi:hypothetical protein